MPVFEFTSPDGKKYSVTGPDGATSEQAFGMLQQQLGGASQSPAPKPLDKYQQAAKEDRSKLIAAGVDPTAGVARLGLQGATFNLADEALAGLSTPLEMIKRGTFDPREGYRYAKAAEDLNLEEGRKKLGALGTAADITGGVLSGSGLARGGITAARFLGQNAGLIPRSLASAADAGVMGAVSGAGEGNTFDERFGNAAQGGGLGVAVGGLTPATLRVAGALANPVVSNIRARINPEGYARSQIARALTESNVTPQQIAQNVGQAAAEGQGVYTVADAMGNPGQRMLSTVTRAPGEGRTNAVEFLEQRQAGQGRRVANALAEGFDSPQTAAQTEQRLTQARDTRADTEYNAVRTNAVPVDITRAVNRIDQIVPPGAKGNAALDSVETALQNVRNRLTDNNSQVIDFTAMQRIRGDLSDAIESARRSGAGNRARLLGQVLREMDASMEAASVGHRQANANFAQGSRNIEAVGQGRDAAMRGRTEDTIPAFRGMTPVQQEAFRAGYVDPLIGQTQGAAIGVNKARPFTSDAFRDEAAAIAPMRTGPQMTRRLDREMQMFETRNHALGGSRTADNIADQAAAGVDPSLIRHALSGNYMGVARGLLAAGQNALTGNTPAVRAEMGRILTMRGGNVTPRQLQGILDEAVNRVRMRQAIAAQLGAGARGGLAVAPAVISQRN